MGDKQAATMLVERLHVLRARSGLSTQEMATRCGLPKSSLESYMRLKNAKRPGVDALLSIANAMEVSLDWLVGRADDIAPHHLSQKDYAIGCFNTIMALIQWMRQAYTTSPNSFLSEEKIGGREDAEVAAFCMASFIETMRDYEATSAHWGPTRHALAEALIKQMARSETDNE